MSINIIEAENVEKIRNSNAVEIPEERFGEE